MKNDIVNRLDIEALVRAFYERVKPDPQIGHFFEAVPWDKHLPIMFDFWENVLFHTGSYTGNPMEQHLRLHQKKTMQIEDFQRWINLFTQTVDEMYEGLLAEQIKARALSIATVMQIKIFQ